MDNSLPKLSKRQAPQSKEEKNYYAKIPYRQIAGSLIYLVSGTRPDIANAVSQVCRYMQNPGKQHWDAVKHLLRYLQGTSRYGVTLGGRRQPLRGFVDADWAGDQDTRRSYTGYIFFLNGGPVSWNSKLQTTVAQSSTESEYMALCAGGNEACWLRSLLRSLQIEMPDATTIFGDNQGSLKLAQNPADHARTKHIDVRYHAIRDLVQRKTISLTFCKSDHNLADILTKTLGSTLFGRLSKFLISSA